MFRSIYVYYTYICVHTIAVSNKKKLFIFGGFGGEWGGVNDLEKEKGRKTGNYLKILKRKKNP